MFDRNCNHDEKGAYEKLGIIPHLTTLEREILQWGLDGNANVCFGTDCRTMCDKLNSEGMSFSGGEVEDSAKLWSHRFCQKNSVKNYPAGVKLPLSIIDLAVLSEACRGNKFGSYSQVNSTQLQHTGVVRACRSLSHKMRVFTDMYCDMPYFSSRVD